jgi:hypothetical protein
VRDPADADVPIVGRAKVAARFGISASTLRRWLADPEIAERFRLRDFVFKLNARWATTPRLAAQFIDFVCSIDPRETALREVAEAREEIRTKSK